MSDIDDDLEIIGEGNDGAWKRNVNSTRRDKKKY